MNEKSDEELMIAYKHDSNEAFEMLYQRYSKKLYSFILRKIGHEQATEDIFQSTFIKFHRSKNRYQGDIPVKKWVFTICQSELIDYTRKEKRDQQIALDANIAFANFLASPKSSFGTLDTSHLNKEEQELLKYRYEDELEFNDIAKKIGLAPASVRKRVSRLLNKLRQKNGGKNRG